MEQLIASYRESLASATQSDTALRIHGSNSKAFYGRPVNATALDVSGYTGILDYSPPELVVSARAGTRLADLDAALAAENQLLPFEPPRFGPDATLGGTIACSLSGPRRPYAGAARDYVLGITCLNGKGELLRFGGQVMKNVAGYDLSRTLTGSHGTLAVLLDITLRILPRPETELTLCQSASEANAIKLFNHWAGQPLPLSAGCYYNDRLYVRLSGFEQGVHAAAATVGGDEVTDGQSYWENLREHRLDFFSGEQPLWRLSVPPATPPLQLEGHTLLDWGGAQRWLTSDLPASTIRAAATAAGGHATCFRAADRDDVFQPLPADMLALQQRLKASFDPAGILNPGHMYLGL